LSITLWYKLERIGTFAPAAAARLITFNELFHERAVHSDISVDYVRYSQSK